MKLEIFNHEKNSRGTSQTMVSFKRFAGKAFILEKSGNSKNSTQLTSV